MTKEEWLRYKLLQLKQKQGHQELLQRLQGRSFEEYLQSISATNMIGEIIRDRDNAPLAKLYYQFRASKHT